jgi:hypothetical protein
MSNLSFVLIYRPNNTQVNYVQELLKSAQRHCIIHTEDSVYHFETIQPSRVTRVNPLKHDTKLNNI